MINYLKKLFFKPYKPQILIFCGAGISAESGLNTFRDENGIWNQHNLDIVCNLKTFDTNKAKIFDFYNNRKQEMSQATPNKAHYALAALQKKYGKEHVHIFTSNVDDLLEKAGCENVLHVHGNLYDMNCLDCNHTWHIGNQFYDIHALCPVCQSKRIKPSIIFFNEYAPKYKELNKSFESCGDIYDGKIVPHIKLIIGTSFKVISTQILKPQRSRSIVLDKNNIEYIDYNEFEKVIKLPTTEGIEEAINYIEQIY